MVCGITINFRSGHTTSARSRSYIVHTDATSRIGVPLRSVAAKVHRSSQRELSWRALACVAQGCACDTFNVHRGRIHRGALAIEALEAIEANEAIEAISMI